MTAKPARRSRTRVDAVVVFLEWFEPRILFAVTPLPLDQTFELHSLPGANHRIYLDFNGHTTSDPSWNNGIAFTTPAFDINGNPSSFSNLELERIQFIWARVAEDFAPFNVDVTTEDPGINALRNTGGSDTQWGIRAVIGGSVTDWFDPFGGAVGVANLGSFTWDTDTPAFIFSEDNSNGAEKPTAETISHEVGHTLGLNHDGRGAPYYEEYYEGHGSGATGWAPIMGFSDFQPVTQWSRGEYPNADNKEDDLTIITTENGFGFRNDDHGNSSSTASGLTVSGSAVSGSGIIERTTDVDVFRVVTGGGVVTLNVDVFHRGPNLDAAATLFNASGVQVATSSPADALDASISTSLAAGTYFLHVSGVGAGTTATGYSDYASLGQYTITGTIVPIPEITVTGNGVTILDGDLVPASADSTSFGSAIEGTAGISRTFTVRNDGTATLNLSSLTVPAGFTITQGLVSSLAPGATDTFTVLLDTTTAGVKSGSISFITNDSDENPFNFAITGTVTIPPPTISVTALDADAAESGSPASDTGTFRFTRLGDTTNALTVNFTRTGSAVFGPSGDYTQTLGGNSLTTLSVAIPAGVSFVDVVVVPNEDAIAEASETATITLKTGSGYVLAALAADLTATIQIADNEPVVSIAAVDDTAAEHASDQAADPGVFRITRTGATDEPLTVNLTRTGTATFGAAGDYQLSTDLGLFTTTSVVIPAGQAFVDVSVLPVDNALVEVDETVILSLATATTYNLAVDSADRTATVTIIDNEAAVSIEAIDAQAVEAPAGESADTATFRISRTGSTAAPLTVTFTRKGTAKFGTKGDYMMSVDGVNVTTTSVVIPAGLDHVDLVATPINDAAAELAESILLTVTPALTYTVDANVASRTATAMVVDDEPVISIVALDDTASETATGLPADTALFRISRTGDTTNSVAVKFSRAGTAKFGATGDYTLSIDGVNLTTTTITIPAGQDHVDLLVTPNNNTPAEATKTIVLKLTKGTGYALEGNPANTTATVMVLDDEPIVSIAAIDDAAETEFGESFDTGAFRITRTGDTTAPLTVNLKRTSTATFGPTGDYTLIINGINFTSSSVVIPAGEDQVDILVAAIDNALAEVTETVTLALVATTAYSLASDLADRVAVVNVLDNEPVVTITAIDDEGSETADGEPVDTGLFRISRSGDLAAPMTVAFNRSGTGTFGAAGDYLLTVDGVAMASAVKGTIVIPAGVDHVDVLVTPVDGALSEPDETVVITLLPGTVYNVDPVLANRAATVTILDDEPFVSITAIDASAAETDAGDPSNTGLFRITRTGSTDSAMTINLLRTGTATFGGTAADYTMKIDGVTLNLPASGTVVIPAGQDHIDIEVTAIDNALAEANETVILTLAPSTVYNLDREPANRSAVVNIADNEPVISIAVMDAIASEAVAGAATNFGRFRISRTGSTDSDLYVTFTRSGTATFGPTKDYTLRVGPTPITGLTFRIRAGQSHIDINVAPVDDTKVEAVEMVTLTLAASAAYTVDTNNRTGTVTIADNDG